jgi:hypothetical protein
MKRRTLSDTMIRDIAERYPELRGGHLGGDRVRVLDAQAESYAQLEVAMRKLDGTTPRHGRPSNAHRTR